jgi:dynactin-5
MGCYIGDNVTLSPRTILKDFCVVEANTVILADTVVPPFTIVGGDPGKMIGEVAESMSTVGPQDAIARYKAFLPKDIH